MRCSDYEELLSAYASNELSRTQQEFIEGHLSNCADCRKTLAGYAGVRQHLGSLSAMQHGKTDLRGEVMSRIEGTNTRRRAWKWLRPALISIPVAAIMATLLVIQPWNTTDSPEAVLAKALTAAENIQSYRVVNYSSINNNMQPGNAVTGTSEWIWEFALPDHAHAISSFSYNNTKDGIVTQEEGYSEFYIIGENQYYHTDNYYKTISSGISLRAYAAGIPSKEYALDMLQFMDELQQLPDENIDGVVCLHYKGTPKLGNIPCEIWIGKDDYIIRQMSQTTGSETATSTTTVRYYDFNADIIIEPPLNASGELLPGWEVIIIESDLSLIPFEEALEALTGNEDWSDPNVIGEIFDMMSKVDNVLAYLNALPEEALKALKDYIMNLSHSGVTVTITESFSYNDGVFRYSNSGIGMDVVIDTGWADNEDGGVKLGTIEAIDLWWNAILAPDPQAYFDALPEGTQQAMAVALSDHSILMAITHELSQLNSIEIELP